MKSIGARSLARLTLCLFLFESAGFAADTKVPPMPRNDQPAFRPAYPPSPAIVARDPGHPLKGSHCSM